MRKKPLCLILISAENIEGKLWLELWNNFNYKHARIEPVSYYFEVRKNEDESEENGFFYALEDESAESKMEDDLESVALPDGDVNNSTTSATNDNPELAKLLPGLELKSKFISNLNLNNLDLVQRLINLVEKKVVYTYSFSSRQKY